MSCKEFEESLELSAYDEMPPEERAKLEAHIQGCAECRARSEEVLRLHKLLAERSSPEPSPQFLAECRMALDEKIDRELSTVSWKKLGAELWSGLTALPMTRASWAVAVLLFGVGLGWTLRPVISKISPLAVAPGASTTVKSDINPDLSNMRINAITQVAPAPGADETGQVRITVDAERRMTLQGSLDDPRIRQVLENALKSYSNPGIRRDSLAALQQGAVRHASVRDALLYALQNDPNLGVRLEALKTVRKLDWSPEVRQALVQSLAPDNNPGVRLSALDILTDHADKSTLPIFERLAADDSNRYVRMKSLRAVRMIEGEGY